MRAAGYEIPDYWSVSGSRTDRIVADLQLFLDWYATYVGHHMNTLIAGKMRRCQDEIRRTNVVSLGYLVTFILAVDWLLVKRDMPESRTEWETVNTRLRKLIADTKTGLVRNRRHIALYT